MEEPETPGSSARRPIVGRGLTEDHLEAASRQENRPASAGHQLERLVGDLLEQYFVLLVFSAIAEASSFLKEP
jgi:hypothetical protein